MYREWWAERGLNTIFAQHNIGDESEDTDANEDEDGHDLQGTSITEEQILRDLPDPDYDVIVRAIRALNGFGMKEHTKATVIDLMVKC